MTQCIEPYSETVIEILNRDGEVIYEGFPESEIKDAIYAFEWLQSGGFFYPPNTYNQQTHDDGIKFETEEELWALLAKYLTANNFHKIKKVYHA